MDIPAQVHILATIKTGSVYYFEEEQLSSSEPHYFVVLNREPRTEEFLILVCASSQVEKRRQMIRKLGFSQETLVFISSTDHRLFRRDTVIDCNRTFEKTARSLIEKLEENRLRVCTELMSEEIVQKLVKGVMASTQVSGKVRKMLSAADF